MKPEIKWKSEPESHDYPAARSYLQLCSSEYDVITQALENSEMSSFKAKDIFRASGLPMLDKKNYHVKSDLKKIKAGEKLSPILLVVLNNKLIIADGYHRMCAAYIYNEDLVVPCKIVHHTEKLY